MAEHALVIIDIQNDYFPGGKMELEGAEAAAGNAGRALEQFRSKRLPIFHVRYLSTRPGAEIHKRVRPNTAERVIEKNFPNSFRATDLDQVLKGSGAKELVVAGMMTHMCVDACATRAQSFGGESVPARQVHAAFLAALNGFYAKVIPTHEL